MDAGIVIKLREAKDLTVNEQMVASYILQNWEEAISLSSADLAKKSYTSPATITRLCKKRR